MEKHTAARGRRGAGGVPVVEPLGLEAGKTPEDNDTVAFHFAQTCTAVPSKVHLSAHQARN